MKRIVAILAIFFAIPLFARGGCANPEVIDRLQELQRCIDNIKSKVNLIQIEVDELGDCSCIDDLSLQLSLVEQTLISQIENISVNVEISSIDVQVSGIEDLERLISQNDQILCSKIEDLSEMVSINDDLILSSIDNIQVTASVSGLDELISASDVFVESVIEDQISASDAMMCSKIGNLDESGTCLDTYIDVPNDINNLNLDVIELLKTILLELRGCGN